MKRYIIWHNPRCRKSRNALLILQEAWEDVEIIDYQKDFLTKEKLQNIQKLLWFDSPIVFTRLKEEDAKRYQLSNASSTQEILSAIVNYPNLLERPIVIFKNEKAIIGRDEEKLKSFIQANS